MKSNIKKIILLIIILTFSGCLGVWGDKDKVKPEEIITAYDYYEEARSNFANPYKIQTADDVENNVIKKAMQADKESKIGSEIEKKSRILTAISKNYKAELMIEDGGSVASGSISRTIKRYTETEISNELENAIQYISGIAYSSISRKVIESIIYSNWSQIDISKLEEAKKSAEKLLLIEDRVDNDFDLQEIKAGGESIESEDILIKISEVYKKNGDSRKAIELLSKATERMEEKGRQLSDPKILKTKVKIAESLIEIGAIGEAIELLGEVTKFADDVDNSTDIKNKTRATIIAKGLSQLGAIAEAGEDISKAGITKTELESKLEEIKSNVNVGENEIITENQMANIKNEIKEKLEQRTSKSMNEQNIDKAYGKLALGSLEEAKILFKDLIEESAVRENNQWIEDVLFGLATTYKKLEEKNNAISTYERVKLLLPGETKAIRNASIEIAKLIQAENLTGEEEKENIVIFPPELSKDVLTKGDIIKISVGILYSRLDNLNVSLKVYDNQGNLATDTIKEIVLKKEKIESDIFIGNLSISNDAITGEYLLKITANDEEKKTINEFKMPIFIGKADEIKEQIRIENIEITETKTTTTESALTLGISILNYKRDSGIKLYIRNKGVTTESAIMGTGKTMYTYNLTDSDKGENNFDIELRQNGILKDQREVSYIYGNIEEMEEVNIQAEQDDIRNIMDSLHNENGELVFEVINSEGNKVNYLEEGSPIEKFITEKYINKVKVINRNIFEIFVDRFGNFAVVRADETIGEEGFIIYQEYRFVKTEEGWRIRNIERLDLLAGATMVKDSDGDGLSDEEEDKNQNGIVDEGETDPFNHDTDEDSYEDGLEINKGYDPTDPTSNPGNMTNINQNEIRTTLKMRVNEISNFINQVENTTAGAMTVETFVDNYYRSEIVNNSTRKLEMLKRIRETMTDLENKNAKVVLESEILINIPINIQSEMKNGMEMIRVSFDIPIKIKDELGNVIYQELMFIDMIQEGDNEKEWKLEYAAEIEEGFYIPEIVRPGDGIDNDGDGKIDEELQNGIDDDGDGLIDEDIAKAIEEGNGVIKFRINKEGIKDIKIMIVEETQSFVIKRLGTSNNDITLDKLPLNKELVVNIELENGERYSKDDIILTGEEPIDLGNITNKFIEKLMITYPENGHDFDLTITGTAIKFNWNNIEGITSTAIIVVSNEQYVESDVLSNYTALKFINNADLEKNEWEYQESLMNDFNSNYGFGKKLLPNVDYFIVVAGFDVTKEEVMNSEGEIEPIIISDSILFRVKGNDDEFVNVSGTLYNRDFIPNGTKLVFMKEKPEDIDNVNIEYMVDIYGMNGNWDQGSMMWKLEYNHIKIPRGTYYIGAWLDMNNNGERDNGDFISQILGEETNGIIVERDKRVNPLYLENVRGGEKIKGKIFNGIAAGDVGIAILEYMNGSTNVHGMLVQDKVIYGVSADPNGVEYDFGFEIPDENMAYGIEAFLDMNGNRQPDPGEGKSNFVKFYDNGNKLLDFENLNLTIKKAVVPGDGIDNDKDGKVDEELANGIDDDGDGQIDEDTKEEIAIGEGVVRGTATLEDGYGSVNYDVVIHNESMGYDNYLFGGMTEWDGYFEIMGLPLNLPEGEKLVIRFKKDGYGEDKIEDIEFDSNKMYSIVLSKEVGLRIIRAGRENTRYNIPYSGYYDHWGLDDSTQETIIEWTGIAGVANYTLFIANSFGEIDNDNYILTRPVSELKYELTENDFKEIGMNKKIVLGIKANGIKSNLIELEFAGLNIVTDNKLRGKIHTQNPIYQKIRVGLFNQNPMEYNNFYPEYETKIIANGQDTYDFEIGVQNPGRYYVGAFVDMDMNAVITPGDLIGYLPYTVNVDGESQLSDQQIIGLNEIKGGDVLEIEIEGDTIENETGNLVLGLYERMNNQPEPILIEQSIEPKSNYQSMMKNYDLDSTKHYTLRAFIDANNSSSPDLAEELKSDFIDLAFDNTGKLYTTRVHLSLQKTNIVGNSSLEIKVVYSDGTSSVGAMVEIYNPVDNFRKIYPTDGTGIARFTNIVEGNYEIRVNKEMYPEEYRNEYVADNENKIMTPNIILQDISGSDMYSVMGYVQNENNQPVFEGRVELYEVMTAGVIKKAEVNINGDYSIFGIENGKVYELRIVDLVGYQNQTIRFVARNENHIEDINLFSNTEIGDLNISVGDGAGQDIDVAQVRIKLQTGDKEEIKYTYNGVVDFYGIPVGQYDVFVKKEGYNDFWQQLYIEKAVAGQPIQKLDITLISQTGTTFVVRGEVRNEENELIYGGRVIVSEVKSTGEIVPVRSENLYGSFEVGGLEDKKEYELELIEMPEGYMAAPMRFFIDGNDFDLGNILAKKEERGNLNVWLQDVNASKIMEPGSEVIIRHKNRDFERIVYTGEGIASFYDIPAGEYEAEITVQGYVYKYIQSIYVNPDMTNDKYVTLVKKEGETYEVEGNVFKEDAPSEMLFEGEVEIQKTDNFGNEIGLIGIQPIQNSHFRFMDLQNGAYKLTVRGIVGYPEEKRDFEINGQNKVLDNIYVKQLGQGKIQGSVNVTGFPWGEVRVYNMNETELGRNNIDSATGSFFISGLPINEELRIELEVEGYMFKELRGTITNGLLNIGEVNLDEQGNKVLEVNIVNPEVIEGEIHSEIFEMNESEETYVGEGRWEEYNKKIVFEGLKSGTYKVEIEGEGFGFTEIEVIGIEESLETIEITLNIPIAILQPSTHTLEPTEDVIFEWESANTNVNSFALLLRAGEINPDNITGVDYFDTAVKIFDRESMPISWTYERLDKTTGNIEFSDELMIGRMYYYMIVGFAEDKATLVALLSDADTENDPEPIQESKIEGFMRQGDTTGEVEIKIMNVKNKPIPSTNKIMVAILKDYFPMQEGEPTEDQIVGIKENIPVEVSLLPEIGVEVPEQIVTMGIMQEIDSTHNYVVLVMIDGEEEPGMSLIKFNNSGESIEPIEVGIGEIAPDIMDVFAVDSIDVNIDYRNLDTSKINFENEIFLEMELARKTGEYDSDHIVGSQIRLESEENLPARETLNLFEEIDENLDGYMVRGRIIDRTTNEEYGVFEVEIDMSSGLPESVDIGFELQIPEQNSIELGDSNISYGSNFVMPIILNNTEDVKLVDIYLEYDTDALEFGEVLLKNELDGEMKIIKEVTPGVMRISVALNEARNIYGNTIIEVNFKDLGTTDKTEVKLGYMTTIAGTEEYEGQSAEERKIDMWIEDPGVITID